MKASVMVTRNAIRYLALRGQRQVCVVTLDGNELKLSPDKPYLFNGSIKAATITWRRAQPNL
jgi:hypothetical protein